MSFPHRFTLSQFSGLLLSLSRKKTIGSRSPKQSQEGNAGNRGLPIEFTLIKTVPQSFCRAAHQLPSITFLSRNRIKSGTAKFPLVTVVAPVCESVSHRPFLPVTVNISS